MKQDIKNSIGRASNYELPSFLKKEFKHAKKLEWITVVYLISVVLVMYLVMQGSQAMKAAWFEDLVGLFPSVSFLIAAAFFNKKANISFPYGYHKAFTVAFIAGSIGLLSLGLYVLYDSLMSLVKAEHPTIGSITLFGKVIWMGWIMILVLLYSVVPSMILGAKKLPYARKLHIKVLQVDAEAQKADWMTGLAAIVGIIGIGFGLWWADAVAAIFISLSVVKDGVARTKGAMKDLMEEIPKTYNNKEVHPLVEELIRLARKEDWVKDVRVRMREHGMVFFGDMFVVPATETNLVEKLEQLLLKAKNLDWKIEDLVIQPVRELPNPNLRTQRDDKIHKEVKEKVRS